MYEEEMAKNEKITSLRRQWISDANNYNSDGFPPIAHVTTTAAAIQQQTQVEVSYQRKVS